MKTIRIIIKSEIGKKVKNEDIHELNIDRNTTYDCQVISGSFNDHFLSVAKKSIILLLKVIVIP